MVYSGERIESATLYDRFNVLTEAVVIPTNNQEKAVEFYDAVLDFSPIYERNDPKGKVIGFNLPEKRKIYFSPFPQTGEELVGKQSTAPALTNSAQVAITLRVKNGFPRLHRQLVARSGRNEFPLSQTNFREEFASIPHGSVSAVVEQPWGNEFIVRDLDGHYFIFYRPRKRSITRYAPDRSQVQVASDVAEESR